MILLFSNDENDQETNEVINWLIHYQQKFLRINSEELLNRYFSYTDTHFTIDEERYTFSDFKCIWIRRWDFNFTLYENELNLDQFSFNRLGTFYYQEWEAITKDFWSKFPKKAFINNPGNYFLTKLEQQSIAKSLQITTPTNKVINSIHKHLLSNSITKPVANIPYLFRGEETLSTYTTKIEDINKEDNEIVFPSLLQECIYSDYEIRLAYVNGDFFPTALLKYEKKHIDIKCNGDLRTAQVKLSLEIKDKLNVFMKSIDFKIGFIDLLKKGNEYVFLELNPIGKFLYYSACQNYYLESHIAQFLKKYHEENELEFTS